MIIFVSSIMLKRISSIFLKNFKSLSAEEKIFHLIYILSENCNIINGVGVHRLDHDNYIVYLSDDKVNVFLVGREYERENIIKTNSQGFVHYIKNNYLKGFGSGDVEWFVNLLLKRFIEYIEGHIVSINGLTEKDENYLDYLNKVLHLYNDYYINEIDCVILKSNNGEKLTRVYSDNKEEVFDSWVEFAEMTGSEDIDYFHDYHYDKNRCDMTIETLKKQ